MRRQQARHERRIRMTKRELEQENKRLRACLDKTVTTLRRVDYWNNRNDYILANKQLFAAINRINRVLKPTLAARQGGGE